MASSVLLEQLGAKLENPHIMAEIDRILLIDELVNGKPKGA